MLPRTPEPELMDDPAQAAAYAAADFSESNALFVELFERHFPGFEPGGALLDVGCGPADIVLRLASRHPGWHFEGVDGSAAMLGCARAAIEAAGHGERVRLVEAVLPAAPGLGHGYAAVLSNSLLHHLADPLDLWRGAGERASPGAPVLVMDLRRPRDEAEVEALSARYAADAPALLRQDFRASLHAAYTVEEVRAQLLAAGLDSFDVEQVSDRHLAAWGRL